ncbi:MAG: phosphoribosylanthranilate isomerase [Dehalococcoidia bacterium]|nr:phosphoribosylanthranilate isomerase [Dehalococcoidia bacterium]
MRVRIKICGITNIEDAMAAVEFGADALGFVFAPSPRQVTPEQVRAITDQLPPFVTKVGVFVDSVLSEVKEVMSLCNLDIAQLHGSEPSDFCEALFPRVIKVFTPESLPQREELKRYRVAAFMIDKEKGSDTRPEQLLPIAREMATQGRIILAGGLTPENIAQAIEVAHPYAVDVSSGVESKPGKKDHQKMKAFIQSVGAGLALPSHWGAASSAPTSECQ